MTKPRYLHHTIVEDLKEKMVFIGGPRQVGKTTLAQIIGKSYPSFLYLNWDNRDDRKAILDGKINPDAALLIFDELHKYKRWKQHVKGIYDTYKNRFHIIVTGSARLDVYRKGGDSLMGRYHYYRLHPFSVREAIGLNPSVASMSEIVFVSSPTFAREAFETLMKFGGFPEPFIKQDARTLRRWHNERIDRLIKEDIRDLEAIRDLSALQVLVELIPQKVGSLFSQNALREDLMVAHKTIALWTDILERFYYHFRVYPFAATTIKSLRKQPKIYLWDWSQVESESARLENMVASHLLKLTHFLYDAEGHKATLHYLRDTAGREVDFLVAVNNQPWFAVEVKQSAGDLHKNLLYFSEKLRIPFLYQVVGNSGIDTLQEKIRIISADKFLTGLV